MGSGGGKPVLENGSVLRSRNFRTPKREGGKREKGGPNKNSRRTLVLVRTMTQLSPRVPRAMLCPFFHFV